MMDILDVLKKRRSVRAFNGKAIPKDTLENIVDSARFAPTARNIQPWKFVVVTDRPTLNSLARLAENGRFIADCSACVAVFCSDTKYYLEDGCAATQNILLSACAFGIGSCWVAGDKKDYAPEVCRLLGAPEGLKLVSLLALGYSDDKDIFKITQKKPLAELMHWDKF